VEGPLSGLALLGRAPEVAEGIRRITVPTPWPIGPVNVHLIEDEPLTLVDTGPAAPRSVAALEAGLAAAGHRVEDLGRIVLTHQHIDHVGAAAALVRRSGAEVWALDAVAPWLAAYPDSQMRDDRVALEIMRRHGAPPEDVAAVAADLLVDVAFSEPVRVDRGIVDGDVVPFAARELRVLHLPGHSPSDTVFLDERRRVLLAGDVLLGHMSSKPLLAVPLGMDWPAGRPPGISAQVASLRRLATLPGHAVLPGHGATIADAAALARRRLAAIERRTADVAAALARRGAATAAEIAGELWPATPPDLRQFPLNETVGHLGLLAAAGRATETLRDDLVVVFAAA
jgi:glyoxylase-like metal-dependent hydrolase (beta-lactamase superfamily II)